MVVERFAHRNLTTYVGLISLILLMAGLAVGQSPAAADDKPAAQASESQRASGAVSANTPAVAKGEKPTTAVAAEADKSAIEITKTKVEPTAPPSKAAPPAPQCTRKITADVVAIPHPIMLNRLGAAIPNGMIFALRRDTVNGQLRADKRPRPIVLRANVGDCLTIKFENAIPVSNFASPRPP